MPKHKYHINPMSGEKSKVDSSLFGHYRGSENVMRIGDQYEAGKAKGVANIGVAPRRRVDGNIREAVPLGDPYSEHLREEWKRAGG